MTACRVVIDEPAVEKPFDYLVPEHLRDQVRVGTLVRVPLHGRRVGGWVAALDVAPPEGVELKPIAKVTGWGPAAELFPLAEWAAWRWAGRPVHFLRTASPSAGAVQGLPTPEAVEHVPASVVDPLVAEALRRPCSVLRLPPSADAYGLVVAAAALGPTLVIAPAHSTAQVLASRLRRGGVPCALLPREWARAAAGTRVVIGARAAAWAPVPGLACVVVLDEHEEVHQEEASPTWNARDVAVERARQAGVPCVLTSPVPSLEALRIAPLLKPDRTAERAGWPVVDVVDRTREDPLRTDLYSPRLVDLVRSGKRVVCVLNRKGRARLLACASCGDLGRCDRCGAAVAQDEELLVCRACTATRPVVCSTCGSTRFKVRRLGTTRAREDLERLAGVPVGEVTGDSDALPSASVLVGTEAVLRRVDTADAVAFLDLDAGLLAPRYRAAEQAMALVARAARIVGGKAGGGRLLLQTKLPRHEVVQAALLADPERLSNAEAARREPLGWPPFTAMAHVSGPPAEEFARALTGVQVMGPADGAYLVRAPSHDALCDALTAVPRPGGRLRVAVDPLRL